MSEIEDGIREWMEKGGRPLEMRVANEFLNRSHNVEQSGFYTDPDSGQTREFDVAVSWTYAQEFRGSVVIECKSNLAPLVVLLPTEPPPITSLYEHRCLSGRARGTLPMPRYLAAVDLNGSPFFNPSVPAGYAILTKGNDKERRTDRGWEASMKAAKAAHWVATRWDRTAAQEWHVAFPVIVTDGPLASARLDAQGLAVSEVDHARFLLKWPLDHATDGVFVDVIRESALPRFVDWSGTTIGILAKHAASTSK